MAAGTAALLAGVLVPALGGRAVRVHDGRTQGVATALFGTWVWPFELLSLLLLVALVAAFAVSRMPVPDEQVEARMIHLGLPLALVAVLPAPASTACIARRNAVLVLIGVELILNAANLLFVTVGAVSRPTRCAAGHVLALFVITIAAAEIGVALAIVLALFRSRGQRSTSPSRAHDRPRSQLSARLVVLLPALTAVLVAGRPPPAAAVHRGLATVGAFLHPARGRRPAGRGPVGGAPADAVTDRCRPLPLGGLGRAAAPASPTRCRRSSRVAVAAWSGSRSRSFTRSVPPHDDPRAGRVRRHRLAVHSRR